MHRDPLRLPRKTILDIQCSQWTTSFLVTTTARAGDLGIPADTYQDPNIELATMALQTSEIDRRLDPGTTLLKNVVLTISTTCYKGDRQAMLYR
jgi:hypothetical protein